MLVILKMEAIGYQGNLHDLRTLSEEWHEVVRKEGQDASEIMQ